jgi:hypothetical protein
MQEARDVGFQTPHGELTIVARPDGTRGGASSNGRYWIEPAIRRF